MNERFLSKDHAALLNRHIVLRYIKRHQPVSRIDIWRAMTISRASVTQIIRQFQEEGLVEEIGKQESHSGRKPLALRLNSNARWMYVFEWWARKLYLVNLGGEILECAALDFPANCQPSAFAQQILEGVRRLEKIRPIPEEQILGLGVVMPGQIDSRQMTILYSVELGWRDVNMRALFSEKFGDNVFLERIGNMIALGEYEFGCCKDYQHLLVVLLENEGVGASAVIRGDCHHGNNYMYGEMGHIKLPSDVMCSCGQRGCLEAVVKDHMMRNGGVIDDTLLEYIAFGISTAVNLLDPGMVLITGKLLKSLTPQQEQQLIACTQGKITNARSRELEIRVRKDENHMALKGMSAFVFNSCFSI